jgi:hypothetical protein
MVPQATCSPARQCWIRAWQRAVDEKLVPYRNQDGTWTEKTYTVVATGLGWSDLTCTCAGSRHAACKHRAVVAKAIALHVRPIKGTSKTGQDIPYGIHADLQPAVLVTGVAPQLAEMFA